MIAHEVGHHVQDELGILPRVMQAQQAASSKIQVNALQVRIELQADCFAGRVGEPRPAEAQLPRPGRCRPGFANGLRHRRRPPGKRDAGLYRAGLLHPRHVRAAQAVVPQWLQFGSGLGLQYAVGEHIVD